MDIASFYINIEDSSGNVLGSGPINSAAYWRYTARMDKAGSFDFSMPASDDKASLVQKKRVARAYALIGGVWTECGAGIIDSIETIPNADGTAVLHVSGDGEERELTYRTVQNLEIASSGSALTHSAALSAIAAYAPAGWTFNADGSPPHDALYGVFAGEKVLTALRWLAEKSQTHFYRSAAKTLTFASTFADSGIRAIQAHGNLGANTCAIVNLTQRVETYDLITRLYPFGAGNGRARLTLAATSESAPAGFTLDAANNYIENDTAEAIYGRIEEWVEFKDIAPVSNSDSDLQSAANMLLAVGLEELLRRSTELEQATYNLQVAQCDQLLRPLQTIRLSYHDYDAGLDIEEDLNILEATWEINAQEVQTASLVVSSADRWPVTDQTVLGDNLAEGRIFQAHPQLNANSYTTSYNKLVDEDETANVRFRFGAETVQVDQVLFEFQILDLESSVKSVGGDSSGSGDLDTGGPDTDETGSGGNNETGSGGDGETGGTATATDAGGASATASGGPTTTGSDGDGDTGGSGTLTTSELGSFSTGANADQNTTSGGNNASSGGPTTTGSDGDGSTGSDGDGDTGSGGNGNTVLTGSGNTVTTGSGSTGSSGSGDTGATGLNTNADGNNTNLGGGDPADSGGPTTTGSAGDGDTGAPSTDSTGDPEGGDIVSAGQHRHDGLLYDSGATTYPVYADEVSGDWFLWAGTGDKRELNLFTDGSGNHTHDISNHTHSLSAHTHSISAHTHTIDTHTHSISQHTHVIANHTHSISAHTHSLGSHTHSIGSHTHSIGSHTHSISSHTHTISAHTHTVTAHTHSISSHTHAIAAHTHGVSAHTHTVSAHTHSVSSHTHSVSAHTHTISTHTHAIGSHTHSISAHTHSLSSHTHSLNNHTHDLSESITAIYGIFRENSANTFSIDDLEYQVNSGGWADLNGATDIGSGWYRLDITSSVQNSTTFRPNQDSNLLEIRRKSAGAMDKTAQIDALLSVRNIIQAIAYV